MLVAASPSRAALRDWRSDFQTQCSLLISISEPLASSAFRFPAVSGVHLCLLVICFSLPVSKAVPICHSIPRTTVFVVREACRRHLKGHGQVLVLRDHSSCRKCKLQLYWLSEGAPGACWLDGGLSLRDFQIQPLFSLYEALFLPKFLHSRTEPRGQHLALT